MDIVFKFLNGVVWQKSVSCNWTQLEKFPDCVSFIKRFHLSNSVLHGGKKQ